MSEQPLRAHALRVRLMTAGLTPGDAISNYITLLARMLRGWGARVDIYADHIAPAYQTQAQPSQYYEPTGRDLLWYHYSLAADNIDRVLASPDLRIMDFHGICPPHLFHGQNAQLEYLCQLGLDRLPEVQPAFERVIVHSDDARQTLLGHGYDAEQITKFYLAADTTRLVGAADDVLEQWLPQVEYLLMVGRVVPQKDVMALLHLFAEVHKLRPQTVLIIAGNRDQAERYQRQLDDEVARLGLGDRVLFTGQVNNPAVLASLYRHSRLLLVTSEWESFCVPIAEAMSFGVPAAVHDQPPMSEIAGPGGILFDKRAPAQAAARLVEVLADENLYAQLSTAAQHWAPNYTEDALRRNVLAFLGSLVATPETAV